MDKEIEELALLLGNGCCINEDKPKPCSGCYYTARRVIEFGYVKPSGKVTGMIDFKEISRVIQQSDRNFRYTEDDDGDKHYDVQLSQEYCDFIAQAIHSAIPAQREVRYPEYPVKTHRSSCHCGYCQKINFTTKLIDEMKKLNGDKI